MQPNRIVSREEWRAERTTLLVKEKELTRLRDRLAAERRALPWVRVEKQYVFDGSSGKVTLADLFDGRSQLFIKHFMLAPAFRFYAELFGWQKTDAVESPIGTYQMYGKNGRTLGGMATKPKDYPSPPHWLYYVKVADLDAALARVRKDGGRVMNGPMEVPGGDRVAQCLDPQGAAFALHEVKGNDT